MSAAEHADPSSPAGLRHGAASTRRGHPKKTTTRPTSPARSGSAGPAPGTVRVLAHRGLRRLAAELTEDHQVPQTVQPGRQ